MEQTVAPERADILSMTEEETVAYVSSELSEPAYRGAQLYSWMQKGVQIDGMTNLPLSLRNRLHYIKS